MSHQLPNLQAQRVSASQSIGTLAKKANVSDAAIRRGELGAAISVVESGRIADALGVSLATLGKQDY